MDKNKEKALFEHIDHAINDPPLTIEESLDQAVIAGRMTIKEAEECKEAYHRTFHPDDYPPAA